MESTICRPCEADARQVEDQTSELIVALHLQDLDEMANLSKGKGREDVLTDADKALQVYRHELQCKKLLLADRRMCLSIGIAVGLDGHAIANHKLEEERAARDRQIALAGTTILPRHCDKTEMEEDKGLEEIVARFASLNTFVPNALSSPSEDNCGEASCSRSKADTQEIHDICIACAGREIKTRLVRGPCLHAYCTDCIKSLFEAAITDESLFPPSCCRQRFSLSEVKSHLPNDLVTRFEQKSVELATPNRTYCAVPLCSTFIPLKQVEDDNAVCQKCSAVTCTTCKQLAHGEGDCPNDDSVSDFLQVAKEAGWQRCRKCKRMVELDIGCNHIRCLCRAEFCYVCGLPWKTCKCDQWDEDQLYQRANEIVGRRPVANAEARIEQVHRMGRDLRQRHECDHTNWRYIPGQHQCEECNQVLPQYIFECRQCRIIACNRCRRNRL